MLKNSIKEIVNFINRKEIISPVTIAKLRFIYKFRRLPNFKNPVDLNEKINYLKFYTDTSSWVNLTDKYRVREYISNLGFKNNLVKLYAIWDSANDIDLSILPNSFVLKANNGCGDVIICNNNNDLNENKVKEYFSDILNHHYGIDSGELHYTKIKPCIIAEELLDSTKQMVESTSLIDYKIWCLNGEPEVIWCAWDRTKHSIKTALYDTRWNYIPDKQIFTPPPFYKWRQFHSQAT